MRFFAAGIGACCDVCRSQDHGGFLEVGEVETTKTGAFFAASRGGPPRVLGHLWGEVPVYLETGSPVRLVAHSSTSQSVHWMPGKSRLLRHLPGPCGMGCLAVGSVPTRQHSPLGRHRTAKLRCERPLWTPDIDPGIERLAIVLESTSEVPGGRGRKSAIARPACNFKEKRSARPRDWFAVRTRHCGGQDRTGKFRWKYNLDGPGASVSELAITSLGHSIWGAPVAESDRQTVLM